MDVAHLRYAAACRVIVPTLLLLFLVTVPTPALAQGGVWVAKSAMPTPGYGGLGEAIVGTGTYIYAIRCASTGACQFRRYDPAGNSWTQITSWTPTGDPPPDDPPPRTKSGTAFAWDQGDCLYALLGAAGTDSDRRYFYRYTISLGTWQRMADAPHAEGAGDALTWSGYDNSFYAMLGSNEPGRGSGFARYVPSTNSWQSLSSRWTITDDGASLAWTGGEYLYALRGEWHETTPNNEFARYRISTGAWEDMTPIPVLNGVGDGGSLLWIGNWIGSYSDHIFALGGNDVLENPGYGFYAYSVSRNQWASLESLPYPVGFNDGDRLGFAAGHIYYWQGAPQTWAGGGAQFYMFSGYKLVITAYPSSVTAGSWTTPYTVQRQDENGNPVTSGSTTVYLASTSTGANKKFAETSGGAAVTSVTIPAGSSTKDFYCYDEKAGSWTISVSATDMTGDGKSLTVNPSSLASFTMSGYPSSVTAGQSFGANDVVVTAFDAYNNVKTDYMGQVWFTSSDSQAVLPYTPASKYTFTTGDNGAHTFAGTGFILKTAGTKTITITDGTISRTSSSIIVNAASLDHIAVSPKSATVTAGGAQTYTAEGFDAYGNSLGDVTGSTTWSIQSGAGGSWSANVYTSAKSGTWTVTGTYSGRSDDAMLTVNAASLDHFTFATIGGPQTAGSAFSITITAKDAYENTVASYSGTNSLSDSTGTMSPSSTTAFTAGVWTGSVTIYKSLDNIVITTMGNGFSGRSNAFGTGQHAAALPVGGSMVQPNRMAIIAPYLALTGMLAFTILFAVRRRLRAT